LEAYSSWKYKPSVTQQYLMEYSTWFNIKITSHFTYRVELFFSCVRHNKQRVFP